jgi:hypothetical protein
MVWLKLTDDYWANPRWDQVTDSAAMFYARLIEHCCKWEVWDGRVPRHKAAQLAMARGHDVDLLLGELAMIGLVTSYDDPPSVVLHEIDEHIPDEALRERRQREQARLRMQKMRANRCRSGMHDQHCPRTCPARIAARVAEDDTAGQPVTHAVTHGLRVTPGTGTGTGTGEHFPTKDEHEKRDDHRDQRGLGGCCTTPLITEFKGTLRCRSCGATRPVAG